MSYRVEVRLHGSEWTNPILFTSDSRRTDFLKADDMAAWIWRDRGRIYGGIEGVRIIDVARELQPDLDPVVLLMEQRRKPS